MIKTDKEILHEEHDFVAEDLTEKDIEVLKDIAIRNYVDTASKPLVSTFTTAFLSFLTSRGYRIIKVTRDE